MDLRYITPEAWQQFEEDHPAAAAFLNHEALKEELLSLELRTNLNSFESKRLGELRDLVTP